MDASSTKQAQHPWVDSRFYFVPAFPRLFLISWPFLVECILTIRIVPSPHSIVFSQCLKFLCFDLTDNVHHLWWKDGTTSFPKPPVDFGPSPHQILKFHFVFEINGCLLVASTFYYCFELIWNWFWRVVVLAVGRPMNYCSIILKDEIMWYYLVLEDGYPWLPVSIVRRPNFQQFYTAMGLHDHNNAHWTAQVVVRTPMPNEQMQKRLAERESQWHGCMWEGLAMNPSKRL